MTGLPFRLLGTEGLPSLLRGAYGVEVDALVQLKTVVGVVAADGMRFVWKSTRPRDTERRLSLIALLANNLSDSGLPAAGPLPTRAGTYRVEVADGEFGYLQPWLPGRHVRFTEVEEKLTTIATLAHVHRWTARLTELAHPLVGGPEWHDLSGGTLGIKLSEKWRVFQQVWPLACEREPAIRSFEDEVREAAEGALDSVRAATERAELGANTPPVPFRRALCHRDVAPHNVLWAAAAVPVSLIDFDHAGWDDPLGDLMQVSNHTFALCDPGARHFTDVLDAYQRICPLSAERQVFAWKLLRFPDLLTRAVMEWARDDYPPQGQRRVRDAAEKERLRQTRWREAMYRL